MIAVATLLFIIVALSIAFAHQRSEVQRLRGVEERARKNEEELQFLREENVRQRREAASIERALNAQQQRTEDLLDELDEMDRALERAQQRIRNAEARMSDAEKDVFASRMRVGQLEKQLEKARREQLNQDRIYQDILRERDDTIARLQEAQPRRRTKKKIDVLDQQITLNDILGEMEE